MYSIRNIILCLAFMLITIGDARAESPVKGPVFTDYGPVFKIDDLTTPIKEDFNYKILFDISKVAETEDQLNRNIESVARFINMHVMHGTKLEDIDVAVVLHGKVTKDGLSHAAYEERYLVKNPTLDLIDQLHAKGVRFYQCGQSAYYKNIKAKDLNSNVNMALSALTMLTQLQAEGYQLISW